MEEARGSLELDFGISGCPDSSVKPFRKRLQIDAVEAPWSLARRSGEWRELERVDNSDDTLVTLIPNHLGPLSPEGDDAAEDPVVLEQLRALGYIN